MHISNKLIHSTYVDHAVQLTIEKANKKSTVIFI